MLGTIGSIPMSNQVDSTNGNTPTPAQNASAIAQLTAAVNILVSQFTRPAMQQANENRETIQQLIELADRHAEAIVQIDERLERLAESLQRFDEKLDETRQLVAENASGIAQLTVKQDRNSELIEANAQQMAMLVQESQAFRESQKSQLAAIIGNGRRIDRLEQRAS